MKVLVINSGSSSLKYQLIEMDTETVLAKGLCERIGLDNAFIKHTKVGEDSIVIEKDLYNHKVAIQAVIEVLQGEAHGVIKDMSEISAVGHRVVHGGEKFNKSVIIDENVMNAIKDCIEIAPLHNPPNITGIEACKSAMPTTPMVAVFDTAFHQTMPKPAYMYALPYEMYEKHATRKYGFHGTSHKYVAEKAAEFVGKPVEELKIISCHLGNGASICAIDGGKSVETSMGFTPLDGLIMGTRSGTLDPAVLPFIMEKEKIDTKGISDLLNKKSGVLGVSGISSDFRDVIAASKEGNERAKLAIDMFLYRVKKYIGEYAAVLNGVDIILFTAGIGENNPTFRAGCVAGLDYLGVMMDEGKNNTPGEEREISAADSKVKVLVVPTNEELAIARETKILIG